MSFVDYRTQVGTDAAKPYKATLFSGELLMLGLNCLEPGQQQPLHDHADQDKCYYVLEGEGEFTVGEERRSCGPGHAVCAAAGAVHGVVNRGESRLVVLVAMAPPPGG